MFVKSINCGIFLAFFLNFPNVKAGDNIQQSNNPQEKDLQELDNVIKYLDSFKERELLMRQNEQPLQNHVKQEQRLKDQIELDNLEIKLRIEIKNFKKQYGHQQIFNDEEYRQKLINLKEEIKKIFRHIEHIENFRVQELRLKELGEIKDIRQRVDLRKEFDKKRILQEELLKDQSTKDQRDKERETLKNLEQKLQVSIQNLQNWHDKNQPIDDNHNKIFKSLYTDWLNWMLHIHHTDVTQLTQMKDKLDAHRQYELEQRKQEPAPKTGMYVQRQKDEFIEDRLYGAIRTRIINLLILHSQNCPFDNEYVHQRDLLNQDWQKLIAHMESVKQRRIQEEKIYNQEKTGQKQFQQLQSVQQHQQQLIQEIQLGKAQLNYMGKLQGPKKVVTS